MGDISPHDLHKVLRSWLLAEDPYGMRQAGGPSGRIEPTFAPVPAAATAPAQTPATPAAPTVEQGNAIRAANYGRGAVDRELSRPPTPQVGSEAFEGARDPRAQAWGEQAVGQSTAPSPSAEVDRTRAQAWGESAVDKALNPPTGSGGGFWAPGEAADTASAVGQQAVEGALAKKARGKIARGRLKDPVDETDKSPE